MAIAGKVAITPGYEWSVDVTYDKLVVVTFGNNVYLSTKPSTGIEPTNEEYWMLLIENVVAEDLENIINGTTTVGNASKLGGKLSSEYALQEDLEQLSNPNLLVNPNFNINQRGVKECTANWCVDRWRTSGGTTATINSDGSVSIVNPSGTGVLYQRLSLPNELWGKKVTISAMIDGSLYVASGTLPQTRPTTSVGLVVGQANNNAYIQLWNTGTEYAEFGIVATSKTSHTVRWAKLEVGSIATPFVPPNTWEELLKCGVPDDTNIYGYAQRVANADTLDGKHASDFLPLTGGTLSGPINFNVGNNKFEIRPQSDFGSFIGGTNGKTSGESGYASGYLAIKLSNAIAERFQIIANGGTYNILHTGNKPKGSYIGNGSTTARTISIGGIGSVVALWNNNNARAIIFPSGAIGVIGETASFLSYDAINFKDGVITIKTDNVLCNLSGMVYNYQVL